MSNVKLGMVVFANDGGLGNQTKRLVELLKPYRIFLIDSRPFSKNKQFNNSWYSDFTGFIVSGIPNNREVNVFLNSGITHLLVCETPLNFYMFSYAKQRGIKTYCQTNYEFCDNLNRPDLPKPDYFVMPSYWKVQEMKNKFGDDSVTYLPPPIDPVEFSEAREINLTRDQDNVRFLHIVGTLAVHDRNGTLDLLESLKYTKSDFELVIRSQHELPNEYLIDDRRVIYEIGNVKSVPELYKDFDALILPRRYGGLSLTTNEALISGLPVLMSDVSPNNQLLPKEWLYSAVKYKEFFTRVMIDVYKSDTKGIAEKIDWFINSDIGKLKTEAFEIGYNNFANSVLRSKYEDLWLL